MFYFQNWNIKKNPYFIINKGFKDHMQIKTKVNPCWNLMFLHWQYLMMFLIGCKS